MKKMKNLYIIFLNLYIFLYMLKIHKFQNNIDLLRMICLGYLSLYTIIKFVSLVLKRIISRLEIVLIIYSLYFFILLFINENISINSVLETLFYPFTLLGCLFIFKGKGIEENTFIKIQIYFFMLSVFLFLYSVQYLGLTKGLVINTIYFIISFTPLFVKEEYLKKYLIIAFGSVIFSLKRAPLIILSLSLIKIKLSRIKKINFKKKNLMKSILIILMLFFLSYILKDKINSGLNRLLNLVNDGGSGRTLIYKKIIKEYTNSPTIKKIFGYGYNRVIEITGGYSAHNDFLEILYSGGIIGLALYLGILFELFLVCKKLKKINKSKAVILESSLILFVTASCFTNVVFLPSYIGTISLTWAYCKNYRTR